MEQESENYNIEQSGKDSLLGRYASGLGRSAMAATERFFGTETTPQIVGSLIEAREDQEINAIEAVSPITKPDMLPVQARTLAMIYARRALRHLDDVDNGTHLLELKRFMHDEVPEGMALENIGLDETEVSRLRQFI